MSYDTDPNGVHGLRHALDQERERTRAMKAERDANWDALDRLRSRLRELVPEVPEGGDLVAAVRARLEPATSSGETPAIVRPRCACTYGIAKERNAALARAAAAEARCGQIPVWMRLAEDLAAATTEAECWALQARARSILAGGEG